MKSSLASLLTVIVLVVGCAAGSHIVTGTKRQPVNVESVTIYTAMPTNCLVIGDLTCYDSAPFGTWQKATDRCTKKLKSNAANLGANGLVIVKRYAGIGGVHFNATAIYVP